MLRKKSLVLFIILLICCCTQTLALDTATKLNEVINQIKNVKILLSKNQSQRTCLEKELQQTELAINRNSSKVQQLSIDYETKQKKIQSLASTQQQLTARIKQQQHLLLLQLRASYLLGLSKNKMQLILQAKDTDSVQRLLTYNYYLLNQNNSLIHSLHEDLQSLDKTKTELARQSSHLAEMKKNKLIEQKELDSNKGKQQIVLKNLALQVQSNSEKLQELMNNKKNLERTIETLQKKDSYNSDFLTHHSGRFPWPTQGKIVEKFGSAIQNSELKQTGILINAPEGQKVYAVAPGRVIFANWMPGYGLLLIIDHGKGYMTLYGNNGVLYKRNKELVAAKELIATVGHTGGQQKPALYFGLRYQGKAIDPCTWCG